MKFKSESFIIDNIERGKLLMFLSSQLGVLVHDLDVELFSTLEDGLSLER